MHDLDFVLRLLNPVHFQAELKKREERQRAYWNSFIERMTSLGMVEDWHELLPAPAAHTVLRASSWAPFTLFDEETTSPNGTWRYDTLPLKRGRPLDIKTHRGEKRIVFDDDIDIPRVLELRDGRPVELWMSYTPQEVLTQRPGLRMAKGHTVVAGLGMGWLLVRVLEKKTVKEVTLVELSQELHDWLLPVLKERYPDTPWNKLKTVVIGDAFVEVPKLTADVALWDIWELLGSADNWARDRVHAECPGIGKTWWWGAANWKV